MYVDQSRNWAITRAPHDIGTVLVKGSPCYKKIVFSSHCCLHAQETCQEYRKTATAKLHSHAAQTNHVRFSGQKTTFIYRWYGPTFLPSPCNPHIVPQQQHEHLRNFRLMNGRTPGKRSRQMDRRPHSGRYKNTITTKKVTQALDTHPKQKPKQR